MADNFRNIFVDSLEDYTGGSIIHGVHDLVVYYEMFVSYSKSFIPEQFCSEDSQVTCTLSSYFQSYVEAEYV